MSVAQISEEARAALSAAVAERHSVSNLEQVGVSQRLINLLQSNGINTMEDLLYKKKEDLMGFQNFGIKQMEIIFHAISKYHAVKD
jgi:DNA-directed RNA polymerase alpha subunit